MLALEGVGLATPYLQVEEGGEIGNFLLDGSQTHHAVELGQTVGIVDSLGSLVGNVLDGNRHQFLVRQRRDVHLLQTLGLLGTYLVEELAHRSSVGEVFVARVVQLGYHLERQLLGIGSKLVFLLLGKHLHNLEELVGRVVVDVEEIAEAAAESDVDAEQVLHLRAIACGNNHKLTTVVLHALHQLLQRLRALVVALAALTERCQRVGLVDKQDAPHGLIAEAVNHLGRLALIGTHHLGSVYLDHMAAV